MFCIFIQKRMFEDSASTTTAEVNAAHQKKTANIIKTPDIIICIFELKVAQLYEEKISSASYIEEK
jgi:hypothetical protein